MININSASFNYQYLLNSAHKTGSKIAEIAQTALCQLALAFAINAAAKLVLGAVFTPPVVNVMLCAIPIIFLALAITQYAYRHLNNGAIPAWAEKISGYAARSAIVTALTLKLNHYIHEWGHGAAALATYIKADPKVYVDAAGGSTSYAISYGLTGFGKLLGAQRALLFVTAAGLMTPIFTAMAEFFVAHGLSEKCPVLSELLVAHGLSQLAETIVYGLYHFPSYHGDLQHDYLKMWEMGIHPLIPIALAIALPLAQVYLQCRSSENQTTQ